MQTIEQNPSLYSSEFDRDLSPSRLPATNYRGWLVVAVLFLSMFFTVGSQYGSAGVIFTALVKQFRWKRTAVSSLQSAVGLSLGLGGPLIGWMLDRMDAKFLIMGGIFTTGIGFLMAARANAFGPMLAAFILMGVGMAGATYIPVAYVITNWFKERRGLALALAISAVSLGSMVSSPTCSVVIDWAGWRAAFIALAIPAFILVPLVFAVVRSHPAGNSAMGNDSDSAPVDAPGLEAAQALRARSFWLITFAYVSYGFASSAILVHY
jgi:predicted MFS family arabinose efflux permease